MKSPALGQRYALVVAAVVFLALLAAAGLRATPGVLLTPIQKDMHWNTGVVSLAAAIGICLYGLTGPFAAALMQSLGVRKVLVGAMIGMAASMALSTLVTAPWQLVLTWGVLGGLASGCVAGALSATITNRWFVKHRGLVMGTLTASTSTGQLVFLPALAAIAGSAGWRASVLVVSAAALLVAPLILWLLPEKPSVVGLVPYGADPSVWREPEPLHANPLKAALLTLAEAAKSGNFWLLFGTFFVCGFTTNGLVGVHMISLCGDHGMPEVAAAGLLATMGVLDLVGTTGSGWLTDRYDPRKLLFIYYGLRGLSLICLPFSDFSLPSLSLFAVFYGLDWIATVPPTLRLTNDTFGDRKAPIVFGWISAGHQLGAATAAAGAGALRTAQGSYLEAFVIAGGVGVLAAVASLMIRKTGPVAQPVAAL
ncbi:MAG: MFS transporter [Caulobacteraceae bacterium]